MNKLQLVSIWSAKRSANSLIKFHAHKYNELVYYLSGQGETQIGDHLFSFGDHSFTLIPQCVEHNETHYRDAQVICLEFSSTDNLQTGFHQDEAHVIYKILKELLYEVQHQNYGYKDMLVVKLNELLLQIARIDTCVSATKNFLYMINYLRENFHEHISLADCANQLNISYDYFQHRFKAITGLSPQQFLMEQRLEACKNMLLESNFNCTEIAQRCGFCTSSQFSALFKKKYGSSPLQFRKEHIQKA